MPRKKKCDPVDTTHATSTMTTPADNSAVDTDVVSKAKKKSAKKKNDLIEEPKVMSLDEMFPAFDPGFDDTPNEFIDDHFEDDEDDDDY